MERRASCVMPLLLSLQAVAGIALYTAPNAYAASHAVGQPAAPIYTAAALRHRAGALRCCEASDASAICAGSHIVTAISGDGSISAKAVVTTDTVEEVRRLQGLEGLACAALGRALSCSMLIAEGLKEDETFQVKFAGDGPLRGVLATCNGRLESRGYVGNPSVTLPPNAKGKFDVGAGVGKGTLQVVRTKHLPGETLPTQYSSITEIRSGEVPEDINYFLVESEQRQGALAAGVFVKGGDGSAEVTAAGGWYVQLLPFAAEEQIARLEQNLAAIADRSVTDMVRDGLDAKDMIELLLEGMEPQFTEPASIPGIAESCPCSDERVFRTMRLLPKEELKQIMEENEVIEAKCEFCGTVYRMPPEQLAQNMQVMASDI